MSKKNEVLQATHTVIEKGNDFLGKAKDFTIRTHFYIDNISIL